MPHTLLLETLLEFTFIIKDGQVGIAPAPVGVTIAHPPGFCQCLKGLNLQFHRAEYTGGVVEDERSVERSIIARHAVILEPSGLSYRDNPHG